MKKFIIIMVVLMLFGCMKVDNAEKKTVPGKELYCYAESKEKAISIAEQYDIELVDWSDKIAVFHTEKDPQSVIEYGIKNGYEKLSLNSKSKNEQK